MRKRYDILWKGMLEEVFDDLLCFMFPEADQVIDLAKGFEFLDKELAELYPEPEKKSDTRYVDKLVKAHNKDGQEEWLLIHVEVQGYHDPNFAERMFRYYYRIFEQHHHPITAIAIFTGIDGHRMPDRFEHNFLGTRHVYQYNTLRVTELSEIELAKSLNPFALVILAVKKAIEGGQDQELLRQKIMIAKLLYSKGFEKKKIEVILRFLNNYVVFENPKTNHIFVNEIDRITGKRNAMTLIEQIAEIRAEEATEAVNRKVVTNLLRESGFSIEKIASLVGVDVSFVEMIKAEGHRK